MKQFLNEQLLREFLRQFDEVLECRGLISQARRSLFRAPQSDRPDLILDALMAVPSYTSLIVEDVEFAAIIATVGTELFHLDDLVPPLDVSSVRQFSRVLGTLQTKTGRRNRKRRPLQEFKIASKATTDAAARLMVEEWIRQLPSDTDQTIARFRYLKGMTLQQIANSLEMSSSTVHRAAARLTLMYAEYAGSEQARHYQSDHRD